MLCGSALLILLLLDALYASLVCVCVCLSVTRLHFVRVQCHKNAVSPTAYNQCSGPGVAFVPKCILINSTPSSSRDFSISFDSLLFCSNCISRCGWILVENHKIFTPLNLAFHEG